MAFNPRKHLTEEQINEIIDPISLAVGAGAAGLVGYGLHKWSSARQGRAAKAEAEKRAGEAYDTGLGRGRVAGQAEGMLSGIDAGKELLGREQYLRRAHERAGTRTFIARHFGDAGIIQDAENHHLKLRTGWQTVLQSDDANKGYVNAPHTFHMAVDKIKLNKDQAMSDDHARHIAAFEGGRIEDYNHKGHDKIIQLIRSEGRRVGDQGLDALTRTLVHHKHHGNEDVMGMARTLIGHIANRTDERHPRRPGGHEFHSTRSVAYHPDLPHQTNSTHEAEVLRHKILRDLFAGTYKPDERVFDTATSTGTYKDGKLDIASVSRDRRAFEVDRAARPEVSGQRWAGAGEHIAGGDPVTEFDSVAQFHGQPVKSDAGRAFAALVTRSAKERIKYHAGREKERLAAEAAQAAQAEQARRAAEDAARQAPPVAQPQAPVAPVAPAEAPKRGRGRPKGEPKPKGKRGRPPKKPTNENYVPWWFKGL